MWTNLLNKIKPTKKRQYEWRFLLALPAWAVASYCLAQLGLLVIIWTLKFLGMPLRDVFTNDAVLNAVMAVTSYVLTLVIALGVPYLVRKRTTSLETLGLGRVLSWTDIGLTPLAYITYAIIVNAAVVVLIYFVPDFPISEKQNVGFQALGLRYEYIIAFLTLVVIGPIAEEMFFRGYLYGKLRKHVPIYVAMLAVAVLFAAAHGQWNVAIDTFVLSLVLTGLRELTGSIWAGILVHMLKNSVAYYVLFIATSAGTM